MSEYIEEDEKDVNIIFFQGVDKTYPHTLLVEV